METEWGTAKHWIYFSCLFRRPERSVVRAMRLTITQQLVWHCTPRIFHCKRKGGNATMQQRCLEILSVAYPVVRARLKKWRRTSERRYWNLCFQRRLKNRVVCGLVGCLTNEFYENICTTIRRHCGCYWFQIEVS